MKLIERIYFFDTHTYYTIEDGEVTGQMKCECPAILWDRKTGAPMDIRGVSYLAWTSAYPFRKES